MVVYVKYTDDYGKEVFLFKTVESIIIRGGELMVDRKVIKMNKVEYATLYIGDNTICLDSLELNSDEEIEF